MYDNICKLLAEEFSEDFATWILGQPIAFTQLSPRELSLEPIRADSLMLLQTNTLILHLEFQTEPDEEIPFRMADYRLRAYRRFPEKEMQQTVIYLKRTSSPLVYQTRFQLSRTYHEFDVIRLWEQATEQFLNTPGLLPFAALSRTDDRTAVLTQVAQRLEAIASRRERANVTAASAILAGLVLERDLIGRILRRDIMRESPVYQEILAEGREEGLQQGMEQLALNLLRGGMSVGQIAAILLRGGMSVEQIARVTGLPVERVQELSAEQ